EEARGAVVLRMCRVREEAVPSSRDDRRVAVELCSGGELHDSAGVQIGAEDAEVLVRLHVAEEENRMLPGQHAIAADALVRRDQASGSRALRPRVAGVEGRDAVPRRQEYEPPAFQRP